MLSLKKIDLKDFNIPFRLDSQAEIQQMWAKVEREKAAGGYPWTHLQRKRSFNEEIWIDPLKLPEDISKQVMSHI